MSESIRLPRSSKKHACQKNTHSDTMTMSLTPTQMMESGQAMSDSPVTSEPSDMDVPVSCLENKRRPPRGRPPQNYAWDEVIGYVHLETGMPFDRDAQRAVLRARKTAIERRRYWDPVKDVRARRLLRSSARKSCRQQV